MKSKDWMPNDEARVLIIAEDTNLQWAPDVAEYPLFADYYFRKIPHDLGERSRYSEAKNLFEMVKELTDYKYMVSEVYVTALSKDELPRAPKGKRTLIPEKVALNGIARIKEILAQNPEIDLIFAPSMQVNYWLQKSGLVPADAEFLKGAEPRRIGIENRAPYYQPVNPKVFQSVCGLPVTLDGSDVKLIPLLPLRDYPLKDKNQELYASRYEAIKDLI